MKILNKVTNDEFWVALRWKITNFFVNFAHFQPCTCHPSIDPTTGTLADSDLGQASILDTWYKLFEPLPLPLFKGGRLTLPKILRKGELKNCWRVGGF